MAVVDNPSSSGLPSGFLPADKLVQAFGNFKKSGAPSRFLLFSQNTWEDVGRQVFGELSAGFLAGKTALEVAVDGKLFLFDFLSMSRIDPDTRRQNSIAWIDVHGRCFFPANAADERGNFGLGKDDNFSKHLQKRNPFCAEDLSAEVSSDRWPNSKSLRDDDKFYKVVEKLFLSSIKRSIPDTIITSIHRCMHSGPPGNSRLLSFQLHRKSVKEARGNANVKFGWHGTSANNISKIISHGFGLSESRQLGISSHGLGVHLSPPHSPYASALLSEADEDGERHVVLCRVIMGNVERIEAGSNQDRPSNEGFDTGVDDPVNPKWYVVWRSNMNTHIIPEYVVSFKTSSHSPGQRKPVGAQKLSSLTNLPFWKLFAEIGSCLPSSKMQSLEILYSQYKVGKFSKEVFIRYMRSIAGDQLLTSTINRLRVC